MIKRVTYVAGEGPCRIEQTRPMSPTQQWEFGMQNYLATLAPSNMSSINAQVCPFCGRGGSGPQAMVRSLLGFP